VRERFVQRSFAAEIVVYLLAEDFIGYDRARWIRDSEP
jgi:hypothetical protein